MGWGQFAAAAVSYLGSREANKKGKKKGKLEDQALQQQMDLARRQGEISEEQYQFWLTHYKPLAEQAISEAQRDVVPDYAAITADNAGAYNSQRGSMTRQAQRYGMSPVDGAFGAALERSGADEAKSLVFNRNRAREGAKGQKLTNLMGVYGMGSGMPGLAATTAANAGSGFGNAANAYGAGAQQAYGMAQQDAAGWGSFASSMPWQQLWSRVQGGQQPAANQQPAAAGGQQPGPWAGGYTYPSSEDLKENIVDFDPNEALDIVNRTPVTSHNYIGNDEQFVGTIAEKAPPEISNGKEVNLVKQVGTLTGAVQALAQQQGRGGKSKPYGMTASQATPVNYRMAKGGSEKKPGIARRAGRSLANHFVPDTNGDGRRSGGEWGRAIGNQVANYATGGLWGIGRGIVNVSRGRRWNGMPRDPQAPADPQYTHSPNTEYDGQPWNTPNYGGPPSNFPQDPMQQPWQRTPDYTVDPGRRVMTPAELRQQQINERRYGMDPSSLYYRGPSARDPMPVGVEGPNAHNHRSPVRETYDSFDPITQSGGGFRDAVAHGGSLQHPSEYQQA